MHTNYTKINRHFQIFIFWFLFLIGYSLGAQDDNEKVQDSTKTGFAFGKLLMPNPSSIKAKYTYDPILDRYIYTEKLNDFDTTYPLILTLEEFEKLVLKEQIKDYYKEMNDATAGQKEGTEENRRNLLPEFYVKSGLFRTIFGGNIINIQPQGSAEIDLGILFSKQDNPQISPQNRTNFTFDFDQRISLSLNGTVGTRMRVTANYDTESTFDFQNLIKLEYDPTAALLEEGSKATGIDAQGLLNKGQELFDKGQEAFDEASDFLNSDTKSAEGNEDSILKKIELGNVNMPLNSSLITGAQSLFGVKTQLQFGRTTVTAVFSEQQSQSTRVTALGGATLEEFQFFARDYDENRHFFLAQYFEQTYDDALLQYPFINNKGLQITRLEVWITNRNNQTENVRNIIAFQDLGEADLMQIGFALDGQGNFVGIPGFTNTPDTSFPDNGNNDLDPTNIGGAGSILNEAIRDIATTQSGINLPVNEGFDYGKLEGARKLNEGSDYILNTELGYISLNQRLLNDEVLAVAFQYTVNGQVFQVGEFANDGVNATAGNTDADGDGIPDTVDADVNGDTIIDNGPDSDNDGINDSGDADVDGDGIDENGIDNNGNGVIDGFEPPAEGGSNALILKMLKSAVTAVNEPIWDLMMKNVYDTGTIQLGQEDFKLNIFYTEASSLNYITPVEGTTFPQFDNNTSFTADDTEIQNTPLIRLFNLDRLNFNNDPQERGDGFFDFVPGITVNTQNGKIIFTKTQPFGRYLFDVLDDDGISSDNEADYETPSNYNENQQKYVYDLLYKSTKTEALNQSEKNKFEIKGRFKGSSAGGGNSIPLGAFNVPRGSVRVTAGGRLLAEGIDYIVNYQIGQVEILDEALLASNTPVDVSVENNAIFGQQTRRFAGVNLEHQFNENFVIGGTFLNLNERPITQKANFDSEPINNTILGLNGNYSTETPFLTRMVNKLPNIDTDVPSNLSVRGEFAYLLPGDPKGTRLNGEATAYIDDFEGNQGTISLLNSQSWFLSSRPADLDADGDIDAVYSNGGINSGFGRGFLNWYTIDPIFFGNQRPNGISDDDVSTLAGRRVFINELFPQQDIVQGQNTVVNTLDLTYYPNERGPYNFDPDEAIGSGGVSPENRWAGITRQITSTDFEQANVEFIEFWIQDPFVDDPTNPGGKAVINLGNISEDVLKDGRKIYENGLPQDGNITDLQQTNYKTVVPEAQSLIYTFDNAGQERINQDVGYDGYDDAEEQTEIVESLERDIGQSLNFGDDPSNDNYNFYLNNTTGSIPNRYKGYNGLQGNTPDTIDDTNRGSTNQPDVEDINRDNTMNTIDSYFEYEIEISPASLAQGLSNPYIFDIKQPGIDPGSTSIELPNGQIRNDIKWYQFRIPIADANRREIGGIADIRSIRFARLYLKGFRETTNLRFATLDLVRSDWRRFTSDLDDNINNNTANPEFNVGLIGVQENDGNYVIPPGITREELNNNNNIIRQNEQSLVVQACGLEGSDSKGVFKNISLDMRQYKRLRMYMHAETHDPNQPLSDGEMMGFIRLGNDFTDNYYQIEVPLNISLDGSQIPRDVWPLENEINIPLDFFQQIKARSISNGTVTSGKAIFYTIVDGQLSETSTREFPTAKIENQRIAIKGNPNFGDIRVLMVGVKNAYPENQKTVCGEVWFNELRMSDMENQGGWAAVVGMDSNIADFMDISATGRRSTVGFGALDQRPNERSREDIIQYDMVTNMQLGQLLPKKWGLQLPFNFAVGEEIITPYFDQLYNDLRLQSRLDAAQDNEEEERVTEQSQSYTKRKSINFIGVKKNRTGDKKQRFYDVENFTFNYSNNKVEHRDFEIERSTDQNIRVGTNYVHNFNQLRVDPFKKNDSLFIGKYWQLLKDFNFNLLPNTISINTDINRQFSKQKFREIDLSGNNIQVEELFRRNYTFDFQYAINYNLTDALSLNFSASNTSIVRNYFVDDDITRGLQDPTLDVWDGFFDVGDPNFQTQQLQVNYELPFNKIPALNFITSNYVYNGTFQWQKGSDLNENLRLDTDNDGIEETWNLGHSIQNSNTHNINTSLNMETLYKSLGFVKKGKTRPGRRNPNNNDARNSTTNNKKGKSKLSIGKRAYNTLVGVVGMVKRVNLGYTENNGTFLPGYLPTPGFIGTTRPTLGFTFGRQDDIRQTVASNGWLTLFPEFNQQYTRVHSSTLDYSANVELLQDLKIDLIGNRTYANNISENFKALDLNGDNISDQYQTLLQNNFGNFNISTTMIRTAFSQSDENFSETFDTFKQNRLIIANRLATQFYGTVSYARDDEGYPLGFGKTSQKVILPAFLAAYQGINANSISTSAFRDVPIPNWTIKYTGLMRIPWFKKRFRRFSIQHGYRSRYTINQFRANLDYQTSAVEPELAYDQQNAAAFNQAGNFKSKQLFSNINLEEQFSPLIRLEFEMKNAIKVLTEIATDRILSLSFDNNLLTETQGSQYTLGLGYRIKDIKIRTRLAGRRQIVKSDLNMRADVSVRDNKTIIRYLDLDNSQITAGQTIWSVKYTADYAFSRNLTALLFFDYTFSDFAISTSFPQTTIRSGLTIRYNFGN